MADVRLRQLLKAFGDVQVIKGVDLDIEDGEFCVFVGPSGCGKSTLLRLIAGLEEISGGTLRIGGKDMTNIEPSNRGVAMVFQSYALYPHMTVAQNISFGLRMNKMPAPEIDTRVAHASKILKLDQLLARKPSQLSGGQRQRVAIGRAIVRNPDVFLFDEPLSNLDAALRVDMRVEIGKLHQDLGATMIYVTHDQVEAMTMADKIVVLSAGRIEQVGSPLELYHRPRNLFVAGFIGSPKMNFVPAKSTGTDGDIATLALPGAASVAIALKGAVLPASGGLTVGIRPEHLTLSEAGIGLNGRVRLAEHLGAETMLYVELDGGTEAIVRADGLCRARPGDSVGLGIKAAACHLFGPDGTALVNGSLL